MSSIQTSQQTNPQILTHSIAPVKIHSNTSYPLQLSTVQMPMHIPVPAPISMPMRLTGSANSVPLQITTSGMTIPMQVSSSMQLPPSELNVPLQMPVTSQNIQLNTLAQSMPLNLNTQALQSSLVQLCSNGQSTLDAGMDMNISTQPEMNGEMPKIKLGNTDTTIQAVPVSKSIQIQVPSVVKSNPLPIKNSVRSTASHVVYIQTPTGLKPVSSSEVINQASTSRNPPQIIVRKPVTSAPSIQLVSKVNVAPKVTITNKPPVQPIAPVPPPATSTQPIVIQKTKDKIILPGNAGKPVTIIGSVKKNRSEGQSLLLPNALNMNAAQNQKVFIAPKKSKFILPVTMASKGPIINLQIANGQLQNDPQGNITVMRDSLDANDNFKVNGNESVTPASTDAQKGENTFAMAITGSRAEPTGEQEYTLSIPETNATMNDDIYTVSIAGEDGGDANETSFTLAIPEKGKSLLNKNVFDKDVTSMVVPAPAVLKRSYSDNADREVVNLNLKRRVSLCAESRPCKRDTFSSNQLPIRDEIDEHRVPSLFCDEKMDKDLDVTAVTRVAKAKPVKPKKCKTATKNISTEYITKKISLLKSCGKSDDAIAEEDPPGLKWDNNGVGVLNGSSIKFHTNEFGLIDVMNNNDLEESTLQLLDKYETPLRGRPANATKKKPTSPEHMYRCHGCGCHGMLAEFINSHFCSVTCQTEVRKLLMMKKDKERLDVVRKKKMKKLLRKQNSDSETYDKDDKMTLLKQYESMPVDVCLSVEEVDDNKCPWMCGKSGFSWLKYLEHCKSKAAPLKLFKDPFPYNKNCFKVGMRLEAIDPCNPSSICVVSVAEVQGYRMRLHFDEYPDTYDFWVNADSVNILPPGWCDRYGRSYRMPPSYTVNTFTWSTYLKQVKGVAAPKQLFPHITYNVVKPNGFRIGMKLEAVDRKNNLICVATVADMLDNRILVSFDSWDEIYDFWVDPTSPYIHPVGWAEENNLTLTPPNFFKDPRAFSWASYLSDTNSTPVPARAFKPRPPLGFKAGMKLEVVDRRVPFLIRVATISDVKGHQIRVSFDGWSDDMSYWIEDDSPDIHPVGWCLKTGHPLEPPLTEQERAVIGSCGVGGCRGLGSVRGGGEKCHSSPALCPYRNPQAHFEPLTDRLAKEFSDPESFELNSVVTNVQLPHSTSPISVEDSRQDKPAQDRASKHKTKPEQISDEDSLASSGVKRWRGGSKEVDDTAASECNNARDTNKSIGNYGLQLQPVLDRLALNSEPRQWTEQEVISLIESVAGEEAAHAVEKGRLSGAELMMASREELVDCLQLRLGPALKVYTAVKLLRNISI